MRRAFAWLAGALGIAALLRHRRREQAAPAPAADPAAELREKLEQARAADDRDEFDAAEGQPLDEADPQEPSTLEERRRAIHEKAQQALGEMQQPDADS